MRTDRSGFDLSNSTLVDSVLSALAGKLNYTNYATGENNLSGYVQIAEGLTASSAGRSTGTIEYNATDGTALLKPGSVITSGSDVIYGSKETAMMRGAKSAMASAAMLWRSESSDLMQRMGDLRLGSEENGLWAKYYTGKSEYNMDKYSGNSLIIFTRDKNAPLDVQGGDVIIKSAQKTDNINAGIVLRTDNDGINTSDQAVVKKVLDNLSNKLVYSGYTQGERNLDGRVEIAEGLTSTAAYCKYSAINFDDKTGRGTSDAKVTSPYLTAITGSSDSDSEYKKDGVTTENGIYNFNKDVVIATNYDVNSGYSPEITTPLGNGSYSVVTLTSGSINNEGNTDVTINMNGNDLHIDNKTTVGRKSNGQYYVNRSAGIFAEKEGTITINNPGAMIVLTQKSLVVAILLLIQRIKQTERRRLLLY